MERTEQLQQLLAPGETLSTLIEERPTHDVYALTPGTADTSVVLWDVGGATDYTHVTGSIRMDLQGIGDGLTLSVMHPDGQKIRYQLGRERPSVRLGPGDTYRYVGYGVVRDVCTPPFRGGDEIIVQPTTPNKIAAGDYVLVRKPRHDDNFNVAGMVRLEVTERHDTTEENWLRRDQPKRRAMPSHHHALAQIVGQEEKWPVRVHTEGSGLYIAHHVPTWRNRPAVEPPEIYIPDDVQVFKGRLATPEKSSAADHLDA